MKIQLSIRNAVFIIFFILLGTSFGSMGLPQKTMIGSPEEYYNEALADKEQGDLPAASLALRRALVLDPTLSVAQQELKEVLAKMGIPMESSWQQKLASHYAPEKIAISGMVLGWGATLAVVIIFFLQILSSVKKPKKWKLFFSMILLCVAGHAVSVLGVIIDPRLRARYQVVLLSKNNSQGAHPIDQLSTMPLRATPADAATVIAQLPMGSCLVLLSKHGAWSYVQTMTGQEGWISSANLENVIPKK